MNLKDKALLAFAGKMRAVAVEAPAKGILDQTATKIWSLSVSLVGDRAAVYNEARIARSQTFDSTGDEPESSISVLCEAAQKFRMGPYKEAAVAAAKPRFI